MSSAKPHNWEESLTKIRPRTRKCLHFNDSDEFCISFFDLIANFVKAYNPARGRMSGNVTSKTSFTRISDLCCAAIVNDKQTIFCKNWSYALAEDNFASVPQRLSTESDWKGQKFELAVWDWYSLDYLEVIDCEKVARIEKISFSDSKFERFCVKCRVFLLKNLHRFKDNFKKMSRVSGFRWTFEGFFETLMVDYFFFNTF